MGYFIGLFLMVVLLRSLLVDILLPVDMSFGFQQGTWFTENPSAKISPSQGIAAADILVLYQDAAASHRVQVLLPDSMK